MIVYISKYVIDKRFYLPSKDIKKLTHRLDGGKMIDIKIVDKNGQEI